MSDMTASAISLSLFRARLLGFSNQGVDELGFAEGDGCLND
jgi:hypothetical protein